MNVFNLNTHAKGECIDLFDLTKLVPVLVYF
jgi:hypothetical protein